MDDMSMFVARAPLDDISAKIAEMGFNCVRLVYALDTLFENPVVKSERVSKNPELVRKTVMEIMDDVVESLSTANVMIILNNHVSNKKLSIFPIRLSKHVRPRTAVLLFGTDFVFCLLC